VSSSLADSAVFTLDGFLTETGRKVAKFFSSRCEYPNRATKICQQRYFWSRCLGCIRSGVSDILRRVDGRVNTYMDNHASGSGCNKLIPSPTSFPTCTLRTEHLSLHSGTQGRFLNPRSVTVNGNKYCDKILLSRLLVLKPELGFDDGNVTYIRTQGNGQVTIEYVTPTALFPANGAPLPIDRLFIFRTN